VLQPLALCSSDHNVHNVRAVILLLYCINDLTYVDVPTCDRRTLQIKAGFEVVSPSSSARMKENTMDRTCRVHGKKYIKKLIIILQTLI
jgi:hypothetical protein